MPTVLETLGIEPPSKCAGHDQIQIAGASFAYAFADADTPKEAQYFEMFGYRGTWLDSWNAVSWHRRGTEWADDEWELYHLDEDFSEINNLTEQESKKLRELIDRWRVEAGKRGVLPFGGTSAPDDVEAMIFDLEDHVRCIFRARVPHPKIALDLAKDPWRWSVMSRLQICINRVTCGSSSRTL